MVRTRQLSTSDDRRSDVGPAAVAAFAERGFYGTTTNEVAAAAGISQAYLYKLFADKTALFVEGLHYASEQLADTLREALGRHEASGDLSSALREATERVSRDMPLARLLMHAAAAAGEPAIGDAIRDCYAKQIDVLRKHSSATDEQIRRYLADGMLATVAHIIGAHHSRAAWARVLTLPT